MLLIDPVVTSRLVRKMFPIEVGCLLSSCIPDGATVTTAGATRVLTCIGVLACMSDPPLVRVALSAFTDRFLRVPDLLDYRSFLLGMVFPQQWLARCGRGRA